MLLSNQGPHGPNGLSGLAGGVHSEVWSSWLTSHALRERASASRRLQRLFGSRSYIKLPCLITIGGRGNGGERDNQIHAGIVSLLEAGEGSWQDAEWKLGI